MKFRKSVYARALVAACLLLSGAVFAKDGGISVKAGLAKRTAQGSFVIYKETTDIAFVPKSVDPNYFFGVLASLPATDKVSCHAVIYLPKKEAPVRTQGRVKAGQAVMSGATYQTVTTPEMPASDCGITLRLDDEDIPGDYKVKLFVGKQMAKKVVFRVRRK